MSKICAICNNKIGSIYTCKIQNGIVCSYCARISKSYATETVENLKRYWAINDDRASIFKKTSILKNLMSETVTIDANNKLFIIGKYEKTFIKPIIFSFDEVLNYEFQTIGTKTVTKKKGGISRAVVGGMIAGTAGALIGSGTAKQETTVVSGYSILKINFVMLSGNYQVSINTPPVGFTAFLDKCILENSQCTQKKLDANDNINKIKKYKELLDSGIITEDEFSIKKKELLNL